MVTFGPAAGAAEKGPIKIGFIAPLTGTWAQTGTDMVTGTKMFLEEVKYSAGGRKIELIVEDEGSTPATAITKARKLLAHDKVDIVAGIFLTSGAYAVAPLCEEAGVPLVITLSGGDDLTQRKRTKNLIRVSYTGCQFGHVAGDYAYNKLGWRRVAILGWEHAYGQEVIGSFMRVFEEAGGKVVQRIYTPLTTLDFSPYVSSLKRNVDGLFEVVTVTPSIRFLRSLRASGYLDDKKALSVALSTDESFLQELGETGLGVMSTDIYSAALQTPENNQFKEKIFKLTGKDPTSGILNSYSGADWIVRGINAVNGDVENRERLLQALRAVEIPNSPRGPLKLDKYGHAIENVYIRRVDKVNNRYQNTVIDTYPMVSQFWKYNPEEYLKQPVYTRDNPPCKYCE
jgi:branched-chain amino acid transport system substrate-binding protein